jgi:hypothetical protein
METGTHSRGKKKKNCLFLVVNDAGRHVLWWFSVLFVVAGEVAAAIEKKNNKILLIDVWVVETLICVQHFESVVAVFEVVGLFCIFQQCSSEFFFFFFPVAVFRRILLVNHVKKFVVCCW